MKNLILLLLFSVLCGFAATMTDSKSVDIGDEVGQYIKLLDQENFQNSIQNQSEQHKEISFIAYRYKPLPMYSNVISYGLDNKIMVNTRPFEVGWQS